MIAPFCQIGAFGGGSHYDDNPIGVDPNWWADNDPDNDEAACAWLTAQVRTALVTRKWPAVSLHGMSGNVAGSDRFPMENHPTIERRFPILARQLYPYTQHHSVGIFLSPFPDRAPGQTRTMLDSHVARDLRRFDGAIRPWLAMGCDFVIHDGVSGVNDVPKYNRLPLWIEDRYSAPSLGEAYPIAPDTPGGGLPNWDAMPDGSEWIAQIDYLDLYTLSPTWVGKGPRRQRLRILMQADDPQTTAFVDGYIARGFGIDCSAGVEAAIQEYVIKVQT